MAQFQGVITAMVTPFGDDGSLDLPATRRLVRFLVENGSHGVVVAGTTGESPTLSDDEKLELLACVLDEIGAEATVICGSGSNDTRHTAALTARVAEAGAHGVLVVTPYYNKPNEAGLRAHFAAAAEAAGETPVMLYNIPSRSVLNLPPAFLAELAAAHPNVVAVKQANNDEIGPIEGLDVLAGNDDIFARCLESGGTGGVLVASHIAGPQMRAVFAAAEASDYSRARDLDERLKPIYEALSIAPPAVAVKAALAIQGLISDNARLPMVRASNSERATIAAALEQLQEDFT